ncbi:MAG: hypothetical protein RXP30_07090 [Thermoplasmata archaeon]
MARSKGLSQVSTFAYTSKVARSIAPVVGDDAARVIAFAAYGKWSEKTMFRVVAENTYVDIAQVLGEFEPDAKVAYTRYLSLVMSLAAEFYKYWSKYPNGIPEDRLELIAYLWSLDPKKRFPLDKAQRIVSILNAAFERIRGEKGA